MIDYILSMEFYMIKTLNIKITNKQEEYLKQVSIIQMLNT